MKEDRNVIVFDIETQNAFMDVGRGNYDKLHLSIAVAYFYKTDTYEVYTEDNIYELLSYFKEADLVVGFNIKGFDYPVLEGYFGESLDDISTLDMLEEVHRSIGRRIKLDYLAEATLGNKKTANGLVAIKFWKDGRIEELTEYCKHDVKLTKELYEYGKAHGYLLFRNFGSLEKIPVNWGKKDELKGKIQQAFDKKETVEIRYSASSMEEKNFMPQRRMVDIYYLDNKQIIAFCHLRRALRTFNIRRILDIKPTNKKYLIPENFDIITYKQESLI